MELYQDWGLSLHTAVTSLDHIHTPFRVDDFLSKPGTVLDQYDLKDCTAYENVMDEHEDLKKRLQEIESKHFARVC